jgi:hypothetical protein
MKAPWIVMTAAAFALLQACAYQRPADVTSQMARTEAVLQQAERSGVQEYALNEFQEARNKFAEAQRAYEKRNEDGDRKAMQLARQAEVDAQYATAKSQAVRQQNAAREVQQGVDALRNEATRAAPASPVTPN